MRKIILRSLFVLISSIFLMSPSCDKKKDTKKESSNETEVENVATTTPVDKIKKLSYAFSKDYKIAWATVDSLENLGLYKSALDQVDQIFMAAKKDNDAPQVVRTVMYKMKYNSYLKEDDFVVAIDELNTLSKTTKFPLNQIIHSVTAEVYWGYYQMNRWRFLNRTQTVGFSNTDLRTWDLSKIVDHVNKHYLLSLENSDSLKRTDINDFTEMLSYSNPKETFRPTLFDFLGHRALDFFQNTESALIRPVDKFTLTGIEYFAEAEKFQRIDPVSTDSLSNTLFAIKIFKELTKFHLKDSDPSALIDLELRRLKFVRSNSVYEKKDNLYLLALEQLAEKHKNHKGFAEIQFLTASFHNELGSKYVKQSEEFRWERKKAIEICEDAIQKYPDTFGAQECQSLKYSILNKQLSFQAEVAYLPNSKGKMLVNYTNLDTVYFRLIKVEWDYFLRNRPYGIELMNEYLKKPVEESWTTVFINPGDYQNHSSEIILPTRELGQYVVLASTDKNFKLTNNAIAHSSYWVSNLGFNYTQNDDESYDVVVTNRETGSQIENVKAELYTHKYNYVTRDYELNKQESYNTDEKGFFKIKSKLEYRNIYINLIKGDDRFNTANQIYQSKPYKENKGYTTTQFFTDRSIYRPGQTIYFKGIRIHHTENSHTIEVGKTSLVTLIDANYQKVAELKLISNEYGTFSGTFIAPEGGLNGQMHIQDAYGSRYFSVEEYKRPKFEVEFEPVTGVFKLGQRVTIKGNAKTFAGSNVDGASVQYRVTRSCTFPSWGWYRWGYYPQSPSIEISNGFVKTDENGNYTIEFEAKEDPSIDKKYYPSYTYSVSADVTDISGETRSGQQWVKVGYNAMNLSLGISASFDRSDKNRFKVNTTNLNGEKVGAKGSIRITNLIQPETVYRTSLWDQPDIQLFSKDEYAKLFPHDAFGSENIVANYPKGKTVLDQLFNTSISDSVDFPDMSTWEPGHYLIESTSIDLFGETVSDIRYIILMDKNSVKSPTNEIWSLTPLKTYCEPGENAEFLISSGATDLKVLYEIEHKGVVVKREIISLNTSQKRISIPIEEKHRGNITVHFSAVKYGRTFNTSQVVAVPYSNKTLDIEFETFRNKLLPGQAEEWRLKIKGPKGEKVAAEMLAAMYDASLDEFASNSFYMNIFNSYYSGRYWYSGSFNKKQSEQYYDNWNYYFPSPYRQYEALNYWGYAINQYNYRGSRGGRDFASYTWSGESEETMVMADALSSSVQLGNVAVLEERNLESISISSRNKDGKADKKAERDDQDESFGFGTSAVGGNTGGERENLGAVKTRSNLNETAFFFPHLRTNANGEIIIAFTIPEALTTWKFMGMAHTKDLKTGFAQKELVTQKELMVMPNAPRFLREGDKMTFTAKVSNLSEGDLDGSAQLMLFDAITMEPVDSKFQNTNAIIDFSAKKGQSSLLSWEISVPFGLSAVTYRVVAKAKNHSDGEEMSLPILSNRMLVTESMPLPSKGIGTKDFTFTKLLNSASSTSIKHHKLTLEYTSNPAWYAVQAIPYMMEYPYECAEQVFTRYYANAIASNIVNSSPKIKEVFESWKESSPEAFLSNLEKNQELKSVILEETPWVLDAKNESERKKRVGLLFDLSKMNRELDKTLSKLQKLQVQNGGWPWFPGMEEDRFITQHIITGLGHLDNLGVKDVRENKKTWQMVVDGIRYLDERTIEEFEWLKSHDPDYLTEQHITELQVQYLYARSYFTDLPINNELKEAFDYYQSQGAQYWKNFTIYNEGMLALQAKRYAITTLPEQIMASLKERAILNEELGMYWKDNVTGYYWYQAPIETQALLIEAFDEVTNDQFAVEELKVWLLKQKQTTDWKTTKATAEACYALLLRGTAILSNTEQVAIKINNEPIDPASLGAKVEAGTGYFKTSWDGDAILPEMGNINITRTTEGVSWGAMYWQYFEDLDKITPHETPLKLKKQLFIVENTASGPIMKPIIEGTKLQPGDKIRVRIELRSDRDMEYVHMKDMRASGFEPINVFSRYKWQDGLGYYESTRDAATNFFIDFLRKGTYVFEYDLRVSHAGDFSNGITTIQSMYAPEFTSHSEGIRVIVDPQQE